ncbi:helix-turn-helix domain-containing protein [Actinoplanes sp. NPDC049599]|uniref:helix-turn-helix domain-containing protein n=1 Tax=Actinoplanes sp. NPDC049599 TaxID=3363903 RepID=UPI0037A1BF78
MRALRQTDADTYRSVNVAIRSRTEAWVSAFHLAEERKRLGLTQREVADLMGVTRRRGCPPA